MSLPLSLVASIEKNTGYKVKNQQSVGGGSINSAVKVDCADHQFFLKWNRADLADMFEVEIKGLNLLRSASFLFKVPEVSGTGVTEKHSWLLLEWLEPGTTRDKDFADFGKNLAELHKTTGKKFGLDHDNYIGRLPQSNNFHESWNDFFIHERIGPQLKKAVDSGKLAANLLKNAERMYSRINDLLTDEPPSLIHGDLWSGNFLTTGNSVALIDPAVYYGNREIELAFTQLFGGFSGSFYKNYSEAWPLQPGFNERVPIYNLYPLLVHVNLFGGCYTGRAQSILERF